MNSRKARQDIAQNQNHSSISIKDEFWIQREDFITAGEASASIKRKLKRLGVESSIVRRVAIASYEAEINLVIHSMGGTLTLQVTPDQIMVIAKDSGPGIPDIEQALTEGYSTAPESARLLGFGAGMGLSNMRRCADGFAIDSVVGEGTQVSMVFKV